MSLTSQTLQCCWGEPGVHWMVTFVRSQSSLEWAWSPYIQKCVHVPSCWGPTGTPLHMESIDLIFNNNLLKGTSVSSSHQCCTNNKSLLKLLASVPFMKLWFTVWRGGRRVRRSPSAAREAKVALHMLCAGCPSICGRSREAGVGGDG